MGRTIEIDIEKLKLKSCNWLKKLLSVNARIYIKKKNRLFFAIVNPNDAKFLEKEKNTNKKKIQKKISQIKKSAEQKMRYSDKVYCKYCGYGGKKGHTSYCSRPLTDNWIDWY